MSRTERHYNPLHIVKLLDILNYLENTYGWQELNQRINMRCFTNDPFIKSSLKFLRRTPWKREKVERVYLKSRQKSLEIYG